MSNIIFNENNKKIFDNVIKKNLTTYLNNYISDTLYILQIQINAFYTNNINCMSKSVKSQEESNNINEELNIIKRINDSLEKEVFFLNNPKVDDISKLIKALAQRNKLLNNLMNLYYKKIQSENKDLNSKNKKKNIIQRNPNNTIKKSLKLNEGGAKINSYIENSKKNNYYQYNNFPILTDINYYTSNYNITNEDSFFIKNMNNTDIKNNEINVNKSFNAINNNKLNNYIIVNNDNININGNNNDEDKEIINLTERNGNKNGNGNVHYKKIKKKRKAKSVINAVNNDILRVKLDNKQSKFNMKKIFQLNRLNLEKLNDISSNILSTRNKNEEK